MKNIIKNIRFPFKIGDTLEIVDQRKSSLDLLLPRINAVKNRKIETNPARVIENLRVFAVDRNRLMMECVQYLDSLNKNDIKTGLRKQVTDAVLELTANAISATFRKYCNNNGSFPEDNERKTGLSFAIQLLRELILSNLYVLQADYHLPIRKFMQSGEKFRHTVFQIVELLWWKQRLMAIRYQKLAEQEWRECNELYAIFSELYDTADIFNLYPGLEMQKITGDAGNTVITSASLDNLYISIQIFGLLDVTSWPSQTILSVDSYIQEIIDDLHLVPLSAGQITGSSVLILRTSVTPPVFYKDQGVNQDTPGWYMNIEPLRNKVRTDLETLSQKEFLGIEEKKRLQSSRRAMSLNDNHVMLELLEKNLAGMQRVQNRSSVFGAKNLSLYAGLATSYRLLYDQANSFEDDGHMKHFREAAAQHSSLLIENESDALESRWEVMNDSGGGLLIRTVETKHMHPLEVGLLVAIQHPNRKSEESTPELGFITRLRRARDNYIEVAIVKISRYAEAVTIEDPAMEKSTDRTPGILIRNLSDEWQLVMSKHSVYVPGSPVMLKRSSSNTPIRLGDVKLTKTGFKLYDVRAPNLQ